MLKVNTVNNNYDDYDDYEDVFVSINNVQWIIVYISILRCFRKDFREGVGK